MNFISILVHRFLVFRTDSVHLTRGDIRCLDPGQLVSNAVSLLCTISGFVLVIYKQF